MEQLPRDPLKRSRWLSRRFVPPRARLLAELVELRHRAARKFSHAERMFFTRRALEQATDEQLSAYKAQRFHGRRSILDLCCGIGGDAIGLSSPRNTTQVTAVDVDPALCIFADANAKVYDRRVRIVCDDVSRMQVPSHDAWHIDPDRRSHARRHTATTQYLPTLPEFFDLTGIAASGGIKLAPAADTHELIGQGAELEWIGHRRECQQLMAWFGDVATIPGQHRATLLCKDGTSFSFSGRPTAPPPLADSPLRFVYEPAPPVLASGLAHTLAEKYDLRPLGDGVVYFTSDQHFNDPLLSAFQVVDSLPYRKKAIRTALDREGLQITEVKKRIVDVQPGQLLREWSQRDGEPAVLLIYPRGDSIRALIAKRC